MTRRRRMKRSQGMRSKGSSNRIALQLPNHMASALLLSFLLLTVSFIPISMAQEADSRADGNDSFDTAVKVESGKQVAPSYLSATDDTDDYYWINAERGEVVEAHFIILQNDTPLYGYNFSNPEEVDFDLEIYGPKDHTKPLTTSKTHDQFEIESLVAAVSGKYHFRLNAVNNSGDYVFMVRIYQPTIMEDGGVYDGYIRQASDKDADWYKIRLNGSDPAEAVKVTMTHEGTGNLDLFLMDLWSTEKSFWLDVSWFGSSKERVYGVAQYTGFYYLKVHAFWGYANYQIRVSVVTPASWSTTRHGPTAWTSPWTSTTSSR
jgi:hypothetical protein